MDLSDILAVAAGPKRPAVSMTTVLVTSTGPLTVDDSGTALDGALKVLSSYSPTVGDLAVMLRAGGLAVLLGKVA